MQDEPVLEKLYMYITYTRQTTLSFAILRPPLSKDDSFSEKVQKARMLENLRLCMELPNHTKGGASTLLFTSYV